MRIASHVEQNVVIVSVSGRLDALTAADFDHAVAGVMKDGPVNMILACPALEYISSAGLRSMLALAKQLKARGGRLICAELSGTAREVFDMSGFGAAISPFDTLEAARSVFA